MLVTIWILGHGLNQFWLEGQGYLLGFEPVPVRTVPALSAQM